MNFYDSIRIESDEDDSFDPKYNFSTDFKLKYRNQQTPLFAYDYLNLEAIPEYSFHHEKFDEKDYKEYFSQVKKFSRIKLGDLINNHKHSDHFKIDTPNQKERELLGTIFKKALKTEQYPPIGHFHLYTPKELVEGQKAPRIHFFLGRFGIFYILFYDPFHTIHPFKKH